VVCGFKKAAHKSEQQVREDVISHDVTLSLAAAQAGPRPDVGTPSAPWTRSPREANGPS
jgi:hypothetical protein